MTSEAADIAFIASDCALAVFVIGLWVCLSPKPENAADGRAGQGLPQPEAGERRRRTGWAGTGAGGAEPVRLLYFSYSTEGRRASERLVCAICLEAFEHGEACGEVPACRHFFHRACVDPWKKSSVTCPLCRVYMATRSSEPVSRADDMV